MTYIQYIISYLLHHNPLLKEQVGYGACCNDYSQYRVFIKASNFFEATTYGTLATLPSLPLESIEGVPLLFGSPTMKWQGDTLIVDADIIASSYFLMSRYEEMLFPDEKRDIHGRFIGKASIAYRGEFLHRPIVEEYGVLLRQWLRKAGVDVPDVPNSYSAITLTHDVDTLSHYRRIRGSLGGMWRALRGGRDKVSHIVKAWQHLEYDPAYTFPWLIAQNRQLKSAETLFFLKAAKRCHKLDYPCYSLKSKDTRRFIDMVQLCQCTIGLHCSYESGDRPKLIKAERKRLMKACKMAITKGRHHYLRSVQPADMQALIDAKISDDYTMGYADVAGFRLGCCRPVQWINPHTKEVTVLTLHPLTAMDASLMRSDYMNLSINEALAYVIHLLEQTKKHHGEVVLLWHNTSLEINDPNNQRVLYEQIINYLKS